VIEYGMSNPELVRFVREALGCECPDDVLSRIECSGGHILPSGTALMYRLDVGGRLLVYVADEAAIEAGTGQGPLMRFLQEGIAERDRFGFNRFRLAIVSDNIEDTGRWVLGMLAPAGGLLDLSSLEGLDERVHLHVIRRDRLF
jgi:hypothetical protein